MKAQSVSHQIVHRHPISHILLPPYLNGCKTQPKSPLLERKQKETCTGPTQVMRIWHEDSLPTLEFFFFSFLQMIGFLDKY